MFGKALNIGTKSIFVGVLIYLFYSHCNSNNHNFIFEEESAIFRN